MDIGELEGEVEGSDDQINELRVTRKREETKGQHIKEDKGSSLGKRRHREGTRSKKQTMGRTA